jgi:hypothetical protein
MVIWNWYSDWGELRRSLSNSLSRSWHSNLACRLFYLPNLNKTNTGCKLSKRSTSFLLGAWSYVQFTLIWLKCCQNCVKH